jgi:succinylarginine dihydrolase
MNGNSIIGAHESAPKKRFLEDEIADRVKGLCKEHKASYMVTFSYGDVEVVEVIDGVLVAPKSLKGV